ncbi:MAG: hypothetical protein KIT09_19200 [Bryobacteraceae bacterium]|nr:hypothetical protein [Bryobacteraceae bacterium]
MPVTVKKIALWRAEVENKPGALAQTLAPLAAFGADLQVVMGYRIPGEGDKAILELFPVTGKKAAGIAKSAGLEVAGIPTLLVQGDNEPGLAHAIAKAAGDAGVNINFMVAQVAGSAYSAVIGLDSDDDAKKMAAIVKKASVPKKGVRGAPFR